MGFCDDFVIWEKQTVYEKIGSRKMPQNCENSRFYECAQQTKNEKSSVVGTETIDKVLQLW